MSLWKMKLITWKMSLMIHRKVIPVTIKKLKACTCNLERPYDENCNHESYYHEILETYTNKFDTMKWAKSISISRAQYLSTLGPMKPSSLSTSDVRFCCAFCHQNLLYSALVELLSVWPCKNISRFQVKVFFFSQPHPIKPKLGMRWGEKLLITTHLDQSDYVANEQEVLGLIMGKK
jgi:hypothetical protein